MIPQPKFDLGQHVYVIHCTKIPIYEDCTTCLGKNYVKINCEAFTCPKCRGFGKFHMGDEEKYSLGPNGFIGKIKIEVYSYKYNLPTVIQYMLDSTGVGSGICWDENNLFTSEVRALAEISIRNKNHEEEHSS